MAGAVRELEIQYVVKDPHAAHVVFHMAPVPPLVPCAFNWFSVTLVNYLRLVGLVELMNANHWKSSDLADPANRSTIKFHCTNFVKAAVPDVHLWRNKVAAHFAATDPFHDDNLGTLERSIVNPVTYKYPYYHVGIWQWSTGGETAQLPTWALTKVYEDLSARFWRENKLKPIPGNET